MNYKYPYNEEISRMFTVARSIAILSVISAHVTIKQSEIIANLYSTIGSIGVVLFFIMAGYYYKKYPFEVLLKKKVKSIVIPCIFLGSMVWMVNSALTDSGFSVTQLWLWLVGYKTYLYYVNVLLLCFLLFYFNNRMTLLMAIVLNAVSIILTATGFMAPVIEYLHITNYLNVFNWVGFFAIGMLLKRVDSETLYKFIKNTRYVWIVSSFVYTGIIAITGYQVGYFSALGWLYEIVSVLSILGICTFRFTHSKLLISVSSFSYAIYLLHMMFVGVLGKIYGRHIVVAVFANIIVLAFTHFVLVAGKYIAERIGIGKIYNICIGMREY